VSPHRVRSNATPFGDLYLALLNILPADVSLQGGVESGSGVMRPIRERFLPVPAHPLRLRDPPARCGAASSPLRPLGCARLERFRVRGRIVPNDQPRRMRDRDATERFDGV